MNKSTFPNSVTPINPKAASRGNGNSDLSPLSCLAMLASQANQLPTEEDINIRKKIISIQNSGHMVSPDVRSTEYIAPNSAKSNPTFSQQSSSFSGSSNMNNMYLSIYYIFFYFIIGIISN